MNNYQIAAKAADIIEKRGHCKHVLEDMAGRVCAFGALNVADHGTSDWGGVDDDSLEQLGTDILVYALGHRGLAQGDLATWNNKPERTADEVIAVLRSFAATEPVKSLDPHTYEIK